MRRPYWNSENNQMRLIRFVSCTLLTLVGLTIGALSQQRPAPSSKSAERTVAILNGDYPDPSIVRDGDDYYMTNSAYDYVPGMLIWHSKDLTNWTPIARALRHRNGDIWAPDFVHYGGLFYIYFPSNGTNWVITAKSPYGPWSEPIDLKIGGIDPGHIATPEGKRYLYVDSGRVVELAPDGLSTTGTLQKVYSGWTYPQDWAVQCFCSESPKLTYHGGYYYLITAQGGDIRPDHKSHGRERAITKPSRTLGEQPAQSAHSYNQREGALVVYRPRHAS